MTQRVPRLRLVPCLRSGRPADADLRLDALLADACTATAALYATAGYAPPWIGYVVALGDTAVGGGAFVGPPREDRVEIAYFTHPDWQGRGIASSVAGELVAICRAASPGLTIFAKTLPEAGPSTRILARLGFLCVGTIEDHEVGEAWHWQLAPSEA